MELILVLDTNAYSDWRRFGRWRGNVARADRVVLPAVVVAELLHGFRLGGREAENVRRLDAFLREPRAGVLPATRRTAEHYASHLAALRTAGTPIPTNDVWIAAAVTEAGGELATRDGHFAHLPAVRLAVEER